MAPLPTCECGTCAKCKRRAYMHAYYLRNAQRVRDTVTASRRRRLEVVRAYDRARGYRPSDPEKVLARRAVKYALEQGRLERGPCEVCGDTKTDAHHDDYAAPLVVRWLCRAHHMAMHRKVA